MVDIILVMFAVEAFASLEEGFPVVCVDEMVVSSDNVFPIMYVVDLAVNLDEGIPVVTLDEMVVSSGKGCLVFCVVDLAVNLDEYILVDGIVDNIDNMDDVFLVTATFVFSSADVLLAVCGADVVVCFGGLFPDVCIEDNVIFSGDVLPAS